MRYEKPEMELIEFAVEEVVRTSTTDGGTAGGGTGNLPWIPGGTATTSEGF